MKKKSQEHSVNEKQQTDLQQQHSRGFGLSLMETKQPCSYTDKHKKVKRMSEGLEKGLTRVTD